MSKWMFQWWRYKGISFRIAIVFSDAAVGLEPKRLVSCTPSALDLRVPNSDNVHWPVAYTLFAIYISIYQYVSIYIYQYIAIYINIYISIYISIYINIYIYQYISIYIKIYQSAQICMIRSMWSAVKFGQGACPEARCTEGVVTIDESKPITSSFMWTILRGKHRGHRGPRRQSLYRRLYRASKTRKRQ